MATRKIVPRADNEGGIGTALKQWASGWIKLLTVTTINALTLAAGAVGFTIAGGTTSKTLTVDETVSMSDKAPKASPVFTGDVTLAGKVINATLPAFMVSVAQQNNVTGDGTAYTVLFAGEIFDQASNFAANVFTAPITGKYLFTLSIWIEGLTAAENIIDLNIITSNRAYYVRKVMGAGANPFTQLVLSAVFLADMDLNDTAYVSLTVTGGTKIVDITTPSYFSGFLVA